MDTTDGMTGDEAAVALEPNPSRSSPGAEARVPPSTRSDSGQLQVRRVANSDDMAALSDDWNRLAQDIPFRTWDWLDTWWKHYQEPTAELCVLAVETEAGELVGLAPWYLDASAGGGRVIQFLGSGEVCSDYLTLLSSPQREDEVAAAVCDWLCGEGSDVWDLITLIGPEADDPAIFALTKHFAARNHQVHKRAGMNCWRVELPPTWDEFLATIHSSRRAKIRKAIRKHFDSHEALSQRLTSAADLDRRFEMLVDLHQRRQTGLGHSGCFASSRFKEFHREVSRRFLAHNKLRLMWTEMAGRPIAVDYSFLGGQTVYYYQTGMEPDAIKVAPGWLGMIGSLREAIETGYRTFDFLRGDEAYKLSWGAQPRPTVETRIVARRAGARLRHSAWLARTNVRHWLKQGLRFGRKIAGETE